MTTRTEPQFGPRVCATETGTVFQAFQLMWLIVGNEKKKVVPWELARMKEMGGGRRISSLSQVASNANSAREPVMSGDNEA